MKSSHAVAVIGVSILLSVFFAPHASAVGIGQPCNTGAVATLKCDQGLVCQPDASVSTTGANGFCVAELPEGPQTVGAALNIVSTISKWVFAFFIAISTIFLLWGAFQFVRSGDDPQKVAEARQRLLYAVIGIALALLANSVPFVLKDILTP